MSRQRTKPSSGMPPVADGLSSAERAARLLADVLGSSNATLRLGIDVCDVAWFRRRLLSPAAARFLRNTFTEDELAYCAGRAEHLAVRWAAKEAVAKAIGTGFRGLRPRQIEISRGRDGAPGVRPADDSSWPLQAQTWSWAISLSHDADLAAAAAIGLPAVAAPSGIGTKGIPL